MKAGHPLAGAILFPALALLAAGILNYGAKWISTLPPAAAFAPPVIAGILLIGAVFATLHHAEIVGARVGEPLGTLVLTISVTIIEVTIMASMIEHGSEDPTEAREAVFSAIMIVCNGLVGLCLVLGGFRHREQALQPLGANAYLSVLIALSVLTLIMPNFTTSTDGPTLSPMQLAYVSALSVLLYGSFLFMQTVRHRSYFVDVAAAAEGHHEKKPTLKQSMFAMFWLVVSLAGVSLLAEQVVPGLEEGLDWLGVADVNTITGAAVALLVLLPESINSVRAAARNALQTALNGALGSVVATIGLTVPAVVALSLWGDHDIAFGLSQRDSVMLMVTLLLSVVSFGTGRTNVMTGLVHLVVFASYLLFLFLP